MKTKLAVAVFVLANAAACYGIPISLFTDPETFLEGAREIVIAKCLSVPEKGVVYEDGLYPAEIEVIRVLKGDRKPGTLKMVTIWPMVAGERYLIATTGGLALDTDFLAIGELSVIPIPENFPLGSLEGKSLLEQFQRVAARQLHEVERKLEPLVEQEKRLTLALQGRAYDLFESQGDLDLGDVREVTTEGANFERYLALPPGKLAWSHATPGESGYLYYRHAAGDPQWELSMPKDGSLRDAKTIECCFLKRASGSGNSCLLDRSAYVERTRRLKFRKVPAGAAGERPRPGIPFGCSGDVVFCADSDWGPPAEGLRLSKLSKSAPADVMLRLCKRANRA